MTGAQAFCVAAAMIVVTTTAVGSMRQQPTQQQQEMVRSCEVARIIDGDTFVCSNDERVRLLGYNAPEVSRRQGDSSWSDIPGKLATDALAHWLTPGMVVELRQRPGDDKQDVYGRTLAWVTIDVNRQMRRYLTQVTDRITVR